MAQRIWSEEVTNPRTTVPWALVTSISLNGFLGFGMLMALLYCQCDIMQNLDTDTGFPLLEALCPLPWVTPVLLRDHFGL